MAVAVAKGTLVADVVAADTVAGVAPCIMGTWRKRSHRQSNQIPHLQKNFCLTLFFLFVCFLLGCLPYRMLTNTRTFSSSLYSPAAPPIRIMKQQQMRRRDDNRHWGESLECGGANWQI